MKMQTVGSYCKEKGRRKERGEEQDGVVTALAAGFSVWLKFVS